MVFIIYLVALFRLNEVLDLLTSGGVYIKVHHLVVTGPVDLRF